MCEYIVPAAARRVIDKRYQPCNSVLCAPYIFTPKLRENAIEFALYGVISIKKHLSWRVNTAIWLGLQ
jgi:hypothetical protein